MRLSVCVIDLVLCEKVKGKTPFVDMLYASIGSRIRCFMTGI